MANPIGTIGFPRTIVPASVVSSTGCAQISAPSVEVRAAMCEVDQVAPWRVTLKSHTTLKSIIFGNRGSIR